MKPGTQVYRDLDEHPEDETDPGVAVIRIDGGLFFATAAALDERVRAILASQPGLHSLVLDLEGVNFVDSQGAAKMSELLELTDANGVELRLARLKPDVADVLAADGLIDRIGRDRIHGNVHRAVEGRAGGPCPRIRGWGRLNEKHSLRTVSRRLSTWMARATYPALKPASAGSVGPSAVSFRWPSSAGSEMP